MNQFEITKEEIQLRYQRCRTLGEIIEDLEKELMDRGEVICSVTVNGMSLTEEDEKRFSQTVREDIEEIKVGSEATENLVARTLRSIIEMIPKIKEGSVESSVLFRQGGEVEKQLLFSKVLEGSQWLSEALFLIKKNLKVIYRIENFDSKWETLEGDFAILVKDVLEAYKNKDYLLVADLLEYELTGLLDRWETFLKFE